MSHFTRKTCIVGYALNAKKLRKSSPDKSSVLDRGQSEERKISHCCPDYEWKGGGLADILDSSSESFPKCNSGGRDDPLVQFVAWEHDQPTENQAVCDVLIHKLTEDMDNNSAESIAKLASLEKYLIANPRTVIVDPINRVREVVSRARTCQHLSDVMSRLQEACPFTQPNYMVLPADPSAIELHCAMRERDLVFPVICKPVQACGTPHSHSMVIVTSAADIGMIKAPCVVQQYHDHANALYKVYVIDRDVMVFRRQSLPDLYCGHKDSSSLAGGAHVCSTCSSSSSSSCCLTAGYCVRLRSVAFDSRRSYPTYQDFICSECHSRRQQAGSSGCSSGEESAVVAEQSSSAVTDSSLIDRFRATAAAIRNEFGLTLFGFDAILPVQHSNSADLCGTGGAEVVVIDVNYFPSYKEVCDFPHRLKRFLASRKAMSPTSHSSSSRGSGSSSRNRKIDKAAEVDTSTHTT